MVWGYFSCFGLGPLVPVIGNMKSEMYVDILDNAALPTLWQYFGEGSFLFQQDNCFNHTSRLAQTWFDKMGVQKLDWPSQNPDLNPIEHLWDELERRLRSQPNRPPSLQALTSPVMDAWKAIPMTPQEWRRVLFSDESALVRQIDSRQVFIWRNDGARFHPSNLTEIDSDESALARQNDSRQVFIWRNGGARFHPYYLTEFGEKKAKERMNYYHVEFPVVRMHDTVRSGIPNDPRYARLETLVPTPPHSTIRVT
ncbi:transposable element Tcb1 transposase [Trichonephila clavipes]|nr:transposable element Tcb1 transposase [Trichonephila clavipes]